jgi:hypothetical protein
MRLSDRCGADEVAEHYGIGPSMGWCRPNSPGHYLDLISAFTGVGLLVAAVFLRRT